MYNHKYIYIYIIMYIYIYIYIYNHKYIYIYSVIVTSFRAPSRSQQFPFHPPSLPCLYLTVTDSASMVSKAFDKCSRWWPPGTPPPPTVLKASPKAADALESMNLALMARGQGTWDGGLEARTKTIWISSLGISWRETISWTGRYW